MLSLDVEVFLEKYAPCTVNAAKVSECLENLRTLHNPALATAETAGYRWLPRIHTSEDESCVVKDDEDMTPFRNVVESVRETVAMKDGIRLCRESRMGIDVLGDTLIKGCFIDEETASSSILHADIVVPLLKTHENDDLWMMSACRRIMNEDPRRMWIYGMTFEDNLVAVYYYSRVHSVRTHAFDYIENPEILVELVLSFISATLGQLGMDPLVHKCPTSGNEGSASYVYEIPSSIVGAPPIFYKTGRCLYQERPTYVEGRATRVWEVSQVHGADNVEELDRGAKAVLKDVWLDTEAPNEDDNKNAIFKAVDDFVDAGLQTQARDEKNPDFENDPVLKARLMRRFIDQEPIFQDFDDLLKNRMHEYLTDRKYRSLFLTTLHVWQSGTSQDNGVDTQHPDPVTRHADFQEKRKHLKESFSVVRNVSKRQSRFVYQEVCTDLRAVGTLGNLMELLDQALDALRLLYCAGWVHKDISKGNLLAFNDKGKWAVKLCDFEFSGRVGDGKPDPFPRIGTPSFMPHEIMKETYLLNEALGPSTEADSLAAHLDNVTVGSPEYQRLKIFKKDIFLRFTSLPANATDDVPDDMSIVRHNFQHDLESIWWLVLYFITVCVDHHESKKFAEAIFQKSLNPSWQRTAGFEKSFWGTGRYSLHRNLTKPFGDFMEKLRTAMYNEYIARAVFGQLQQPESYSYIHGVFATEFKALLEHNDSGWKDVPLAGFSFSTMPKTTPTRTKCAIANAGEFPCNKKSRFG